MMFRFSERVDMGNFNRTAIFLGGRSAQGRFPEYLSFVGFYFHIFLK